MCPTTHHFKQCRTHSLFHKVLEIALLGTVAISVNPFIVRMHSKQSHYSRLLNWKHSQCDGLVKPYVLLCHSPTRMMNVHAQTWMICQQKPFGDYLM